MSNLVKRSISGLVYVALLLGSALLGPAAIDSVLAVFIAIASLELAEMIDHSASKLFKLLFVVLNSSLFITVSTVFYLNIGVFAVFLFSVAAMLSVISLVAIIMMLLFSENNFLDDFRLICSGFFYLLIPFLTMSILSDIFIQNFFQNMSYLVLLFVIVWTNDTFAYFIGRLFGKHKLAKSISPNKTIEGFVGGLIFSVFVTLGLNYYIKFETVVVASIMAVVIVLFATMGDLFESKIKRAVGVKDAGNIMPGHGGVLDRLDSIIFASPALLLFLVIYSFKIF